MSERFPHDAAYKAFFSDPAMVESLLRDFVPEDFIDDLDFSTLERCSGSYVTDDLRERHDDIIWRISWKKDKWCYAVLLLEFQRSQDHWMALRILSYTALLLLDLVKTGKVREQDGLPPVFPIVVYNGNKPWKAPQEVAELFSPMPLGLRRYRPSQKHFILDEGRVPDDALNEGLVAQLLRLERARDVLEVQKVVNHLMEALRAPQYLHLHRAFAVWLDRIVLKRTGITQRTHEFNDLQEVNSMLEERASQWREELIQKGVLLGEARGISIGEVRGISLAVRDTLEDRFGNIPPAVETFLAAITDYATLRKLLPLAYRAESMQAFMDGLRRHGN